jgi:hypothetical protein
MYPPCREGPDVIDRLISGAGAVAAAADRIVRIAARGGADGPGRRPASLVLAALLVVVSLAATGLAGETADQAPRTLPLDEVAAATDLGQRAYATIVGTPDPEYLVTFADLDADGLQGEDEPDESWIYFLVDRASSTGLAVRSSRSPASVYRMEAHGVLVRDPERIADDIADLVWDPEIVALGLDIDEALYLDTRVDPLPSATARPLVLGETARAGDAVSLTAAMAGTYLEVCEDDETEWCDPDDVDAYDTLVFDLESKRAIIIVTEDVPQPLPVTVTGMLRRDPVGARDAVTADGFDIANLGVTISAEYVLDDGHHPSSATLAGIVAVLALVGAALIVVGVAGGYVVFRPSRRPVPTDGRPLAPDEAIAVSVTGVLRRPDGASHVRDVRGRVVRFRHGEAADGSDDTTLLVERAGRPEGVPLGRGHVQDVDLGRAMLFRGPRPAIRLTTADGLVILSFATPDDRDRAAAELARERDPRGADEADHAR